MSNTRNRIVSDKKSGSTRLEHVSVASVTPSYYNQQYPELIAFLEKYFEYIQSTEGFNDLIDKLRDIRNIDITEPEYAEILSKGEFGNGFPDFTTIEHALAIRIFEYWYRSKGTKEAIETYFRVFLNTEAEVTYPKDNMFIVDGGNWNNDEQRWNTVDSQLDETTMVIQDDYYYQIYSYLITSGISVIDWGSTFEKVGHAAGWNVFGKVQLKELAQFEYLTRSPTQVPGFQISDALLLIFGSAAHAMGAHMQTIVKTFDVFLAQSFSTFSFDDVQNNLYYSPYTIADLYDVSINDFNTSAITELRRPATIDIT